MYLETIVTKCHNLNDMACMFNKYFQLAFNNNNGESLAVPNIYSMDYNRFT